MTDEMLLSILVISFSATFGIFAAMFALFLIFAAVKRLLTAVQDLIYFLLRGR